MLSSGHPEVSITIYLSTKEISPNYLPLPTREISPLAWYQHVLPQLLAPGRTWYGDTARVLVQVGHT